MKVQKLLSLIRQSCERYEMIEEGDKIAVGVSGGKDSLTLLYGLKELSRFYPKHFTVTAICVDLGYANTDFTGIEAYCEKLGVEDRHGRAKGTQSLFPVCKASERGAGR